MTVIKVSSLKEYIRKRIESRLAESIDFPATKESVWNKLVLIQRYLREASTEELEIMENGFDAILGKLDYLETFGSTDDISLDSSMVPTENTPCILHQEHDI